VQPAAPVPAPAVDSADAPKVKVTPDSWDFGTKLHGELAEIEAMIENVGKSPLKFSVRSSCGCTAAVPGENATRLTDGEFQYQLDPGKSDKIKISYNTKKQVANVSQVVTIASNDPTTPQVMFRVSGTLKNLYTMFVDEKPQDRITFAGIDRRVEAKQSMILRNSMGEPAELKLSVPETEFFKAELEEVKPGVEYKLTVHTKPPLKYGVSTGEIGLSVAHKGMSELKVPVTSSIQARVYVNRANLTVPEGTTAPIRQRLQVRYQSSTPIRVIGFDYSDPSIKAEVLPGPGDRSHGLSQAYGLIDIEVTLPPASQLPVGGAKLTINTDDLDPEFQKFEIPISVQTRMPRPPRTTTPPAEPTPDE
jgi:hypothetical protein